MSKISANTCVTASCSRFKNQIFFSFSGRFGIRIVDLAMELWSPYFIFFVIAGLPNMFR